MYIHIFCTVGIHKMCHSITIECVLLNVYYSICADGLFLILCKYCNMPNHSRITCRRFNIKILVMLVGGEFQIMNFYGPQSHHYNCFPQGLMYMYLDIQCICLCHTDVSVVYIVKEVASFQGAWSINKCGT